MNVTFYVNEDHILEFIHAVNNEDFVRCSSLDVSAYEPFPPAQYMQVSLNGNQASALILNMITNPPDFLEEDIPF
jgi:hypothetical protein